MLGSDVLEWRKISRRQTTPVHVILFVTDHCNAKCGTCFYWQNLNQGESLKADHIEKISQALGEIIWLDISGGEPFLRKDLASILHTFLDRNGVRAINIPTNAIQTDVIARTVNQSLESDKKFKLNIAVSLDGIGENHDRVRGVPGNYKRALATIAALQKIRERDPRLTLSVVSTLMRHNVADIKELLDLGLNEWKLDYHSLNILRGKWMDAKLEPPTPEQFAEVAKVQLHHCRHYFEGRFGGAVSGWLATVGRFALNRYYMNELEGTPKKISCNAGKVSAVIDANGDVFFCELLKKVGNLKDYDWNFQKLWTDFEAQQLRKNLSGGCHCTHECFHTKNLIFSPLQLL